MTAPLVVIGGSKGGVEALSLTFGAMPTRLRAPIAMVLHRRADSTAALATYLGRQIRREITEPEDDEPLLPGRIYLAPADYHLVVEPGSLRLDVSAPVFFARPAIDVLFETAADSHRDQTVAILLSGASEDGAAGLVRVAACGGTAIVQDPATASSPIAPRAALALLKRARVLGPEAIGRFLAAHCR